MGNISQMPLPRLSGLSSIAAQSKVRAIAVASGRVIFTDHAEQRMVERNISRLDVLQVLRKGYVDDPPSEPNAGEWKCKVTANLRGRTAGVVTVILDLNGELVVVTVEWEDFK